jgi:hypothetical protein
MDNTCTLLLSDLFHTELHEDTLGKSVLIAPQLISSCTGINNDMPNGLKTFIYYKSLLEFSEVTMGRQKCRHDNTISAYSLCYQKNRRKQKSNRDFEKIITSYGTEHFLFC